MSARARLAAMGPVGLALVAILAVESSACFDRSCEDSFAERPAGSGRLVDSDTWESNSIDSPWIDYGPRRTIFFRWPELGGRRPDILLPYISSSPTPLADPTQNFTLAGGDLATFTNVTPEGAFVRNNTCAQYYIRLVASASRAASADGGVATEDAGAPKDAGADGGL